MARHNANHVNVVYAPSAEVADKALAAKAAMFAELGLHGHGCGPVDSEAPMHSDVQPAGLITAEPMGLHVAGFVPQRLRGTIR